MTDSTTALHAVLRQLDNFVAAPFIDGVRLPRNPEALYQAARSVLALPLEDATLCDVARHLAANASTSANEPALLSLAGALIDAIKLLLPTKGSSV